MSYEYGHKRGERLVQKQDTLDGLKALYESWEGIKDEDDEYMKHLRERIHRCETQLTNMGK